MTVADATRCSRCTERPAQSVDAPVPFEGDDLCVDCDREVNALDCPRCHGDCEIGVQGYSTNPSNGIPVPDPQQETTAPCPDCHATGRACA